jgi:hypothetical protein
MWSASAFPASLRVSNKVEPHYTFNRRLSAFASVCGQGLYLEEEYVHILCRLEPVLNIQIFLTRI